MTTNTKKTVQSILPFILFTLAISLLVLSVYFIYDGIIAMQKGSTDYISQIATGIFGILSSIYMLTRYMKRLRVPQQPPEPNIVTVVECKNCGLKQIRKFTKEDYILKSVENCVKCNIPMLINGIYSEEIKKTN